VPATLSRAPTVAEIFDRLRDSLGLEAAHLDRAHTPALPHEAGGEAAPALVGPLNLVHPNRIQVLGPAERHYWGEQTDVERNRMLAQLFRPDLYGLVFTDGLDPLPELVARARLEGVPLLRAQAPVARVIRSLRHHLERALAARVVLHGVFLDVLGVGVLLSGASSVGKSELALELISRGHSLVADDAPEFSRPVPDAVEGESPPVIQDFLEVSGMGVLNIRAMYGDAAIRHTKRLQLIIHLEPLTRELRRQLDRLNGNFSMTEVLGVDVATITLPVAPGRNLAVMVEAGVRNFLLARRGYSAATELMERQEAVMQRERSCD
jgi:HPr kinase/phosphorylase